MNIINAHIEWHKDTGIDPQLVLTVDEELPCDSDDGWIWEKKFDEASNTTMYYAQRSDGLVRFYWGQHFDKVDPYETSITVDGVEVKIKNPAASSSGVINWYDLGPCIEATFVNKDGDPMPMDYYTHITINKCIQLIQNFLPNVKLVRKDQGDTEEINYIFEELDEELSSDEEIIYPE